MKLNASTLATLCVLTVLSAHGQVPPPERLLPEDTLALFTVPDAVRARQIYEQSPQTRFWHDPAMRPFKEKFMGKLQSEVVEPLERELGVRFMDLANLVQGQFTLALLQGDWQGNPGQKPGFLLLMDAKDQSDQLRTTLDEIKKRWSDAGKPIKTETIRDTEFATLTVSADDISATLRGVFSDDPDENADSEGDTGLPMLVGQTGSLLIVGSGVGDIERVLARLAGGLVSPLADQATYAGHHATLFRQASAYAWIHTGPFIDVLLKKASEESGATDEEGVALPTPDKIFRALGIAGLRALAFTQVDGPDGSLVRFFANVPAAQRTGLFKMLTLENKPAAPPEFVPADAVTFTRWRIDGTQAWNTLETTLTELFPAFPGTVNFFEDMLKQQDPAFNLRGNLIQNLGDDFISFQKNPRVASLEAAASPPSLFLIGTANGEQMVATLKTLSVLMNAGGTGTEEREFLGRTIHSLPLQAPSPSGDTLESAGKLHFTTSRGYVAISTDEATLEAFLRSGDDKPRPLAATPGLLDAAQKVGGTDKGLFGFDNQNAQLKLFWEVLKTDQASIETLINMSPLAAQMAPATALERFREWIDLSLLPPFDAVSRFFHFSVYSAELNADGFDLKVFAPTPPELRN